MTGESREEIARDIEAVRRIEAVPTLLQVLCETTGMGFAAVARVTEESWTACAVQDNIKFGLASGGQLNVESTLCIESRRANLPIVIDQASTDERYRDHHTPRTYNIESYVSVPIVLKDGRYFGNLCAIDPRPAQVSDPRIMSMFNRFAHLIALQLDSEIEREHTQAALLDARAVGELREQFIAILGHDLRNPLQAMFAGCELLTRRVADPAALSVIERMKANAKRMTALINDVLDFARGRLGAGIGVEFTDADHIDAGLMAVVRELQDGQPNRTIVADINVHRRVRCDLGRVQQLASNLLGNALAHGAADRPVTISARVEDAEFVLSVANAGEPIAPENIDKIFAPFWRRSTAANREGLGLGLHICSQIVRAHAGRLSVTSSREHGTEFTARLPLTETRALDVAAH